MESSDEIEKLRAENERLRALLWECPRHIEGNVGSWQAESKYMSEQGRLVAAQRISDGEQLLVDIRAALAAKEEKRD